MHATETSLPLVSIIMPAFNGEPYIGAAIRSVLAQSYARWELLILDDGSACLLYTSGSDEESDLLCVFFVKIL